MKLELDENLGRTVRELLRARGHDVSSVPEQGLSSAPDEAVIQHCTDEDRRSGAFDSMRPKRRDRS